MTQAAEPFNNDDLVRDQQQPRKVVLLSVGGTITGKGRSPTDTTHYEAGFFDIEEVIKPVKGLWQQRANVIVDPLFSLDSIDLDLRRKVALSHRVKEHLDCSEVVGVVVSIGTDDMAVVALFLSFTLSHDLRKRVLLVGSMKPHTAPGAGGAGDILAAVNTVLVPHWRGVGMLTNDKVMRPFGTLKKGNYFKPGSEPLLAEIRDFEPQFASLPPEAPRRVPKYVDISGLTSEDLPSEVEIIPVHAGCSADQFSSAVDRGVKGIILEGYNDGWWPDASKGQIAERAKSDELVVVMTSRHCSARVTEARVDGVLPGGEWISDQLLNILQIFIKLEYNKKGIKEFILNPFEWITVA